MKLLNLVGYTVGGATPKIFGWAKFLPPPRPPFRLLYLSFPSSFPSLALEVGPLNTARGLGSDQRGLGRSPAESEFGAF